MQSPCRHLQGRALRVLAPLLAALLLLTMVAYHRHTTAWRQMSEVPLQELELEADVEAQQEPPEAMEGWPNSTCGPTATARGPGQRVVSYSFYGNIYHTRGYFKGIARNAMATARLYPGWTMRLYHEVPPGGNHGVSRELEELSRQFPHLDLCYVGDAPGYGDLRGQQQNTWRFLAMADPLVDVFISRDLDALPLQREVDAVGEWLQSNTTFHVMRDHSEHRGYILAGMWGARPHLKREALRVLAEAITAQPKGRKELDQSLLLQFVWPAIRGDVWQNDAYYCDWCRSHGHMRPFPTRRNQTAAYKFVGNRFGIDNHSVLEQCPVQCRPVQHRDWLYC